MKKLAIIGALITAVATPRAAFAAGGHRATPARIEKLCVAQPLARCDPPVFRLGRDAEGSVPLPAEGRAATAGKRRSP